MGKAGKIAVGAVVFIAGLWLWMLYRLYDKLVIITSVQGVKISKGNIVVRTVSRLKNPTASVLYIKPPFVSVLIDGVPIASSNIPSDPAPIKIGALSESAVNAEIELPLMSLPKLFKAGQKIKVKTFIRFGPFGLLSATQEEEMAVPALSI